MQNNVNIKSGRNKQQTQSKTYTKREDRQSLIQSPFTTSGQETERVYSYNPGARIGQSYEKYLRCITRSWTSRTRSISNLRRNSSNACRLSLSCRILSSYTSYVYQSLNVNINIM